MITILTVDDNEGDQFLNEMLLKSYNEDIVIHKAYDGEEAIDILNKGINPDIILLDINMPRMNGHEFLDEYFGDKSVAVPVVVMLTSSDQEKDKEKTKKYKNVKDYCLKPMSEEYVERLVKIAEVEG